MNLYSLTRKDNRIGYGEYTGAVIAAKTGRSAAGIMINLENELSSVYRRDWNCDLIGDAIGFHEEEVVSSSFNGSDADKLRERLYQFQTVNDVKSACIYSNTFIKVSDGRIGVVAHWFGFRLQKGCCIMWFGEIEDGKPKLVEVLVQEDWVLCPDFRDEK